LANGDHDQFAGGRFGIRPVEGRGGTLRLFAGRLAVGEDLEPFGTVTVKSYVALSRRLSSTGYQVADPVGCDNVTTPSCVGIQPEMPSTLSLIGFGVPA
jgi:hypothetical protein